MRKGHVLTASEWNIGQLSVTVKEAVNMYPAGTRRTGHVP